MTDSRFSCYLIGGDTLLVECGNVLLEHGHEIHGVITASPRIRSWAEGRGLETLDVRGDYESRLRAEPFDYLFSITHLSIIPDEILSLPARMGINFHDGPLPHYAGLNTPVWAILNGEESYGVSWHVLSSRVDEGDVLKQVHFEIAPGETALSLNTKCMAAALESFPELITELAEGRETRTPSMSPHLSRPGA